MDEKSKLRGILQSILNWMYVFNLKWIEEELVELLMFLVKFVVKSDDVQKVSNLIGIFWGIK